MYIMGYYVSMLALIVGILAILILWVLLVVGHWTMFQKAGEKGWKSLIPIYSDYIVFKMVWNTRSFWIYFIRATLSMITTGSTLQGSSNGLMGIVSWISTFGMSIWAIIASAKTALAFGKGPAYAFGMVLLPSIFAAIIGLGSSEYQGPK